jgi:hypothetical protein
VIALLAPLAARAAPLLARLTAQLVPLAVAGSIGLAVGGGLVIAWEHKAPFGLGLAQKLDKSRAQLATAEGKLKASSAEIARVAGLTHEWAGTYGRLQTKREAEGKACAAALAASANFYKGRCDAAFSAGVTAGKVIGGRSNANGSSGVAAGGPHVGEPVGGSRPGELRGPVGLRDDFAAQWGTVGGDSAPRDR